MPCWTGGHTARPHAGCCGSVPRMHLGVIGLGRDWLVPPLPREFDDPAEAAWAGPRRTPHPAGCFTEPVRLARPLEDYPFTRTYIKATGEPRPDDGGPFWAAADRA